jgi:hypothetical protein
LIGEWGSGERSVRESLKARGRRDGQIAVNRQIDVRELRVNAHTIVCGRSAITNRVRASVWAFTHALANVDLAVETLFSITTGLRPLCRKKMAFWSAGPKCGN